MSRPPQYHQHGQKLGRYQLGHTQYHGAHGPVYSATADGVPCAVKLLYQDDATMPKLVEHPRLARILDVDDVGDYLVVATEWLDGHFLPAEQSFNPLAPQRALSLVAAICEPLAALHVAGRKHGNLKGSNVFVGRPASLSAEAGELKILDPALQGWQPTDDLAELKKLLGYLLEGAQPTWWKSLEQAKSAGELGDRCRLALAVMPEEERMRPFTRPPQAPAFTGPFPTNWSPPPSSPAFNYKPSK